MKRELALGKACEITPLAPISKSFIKCERNHKSPDWRLFCGGIGRVITLDLGELYALSSIEASFLHNREENAFCPEKIDIALSENGAEYYEVGVVEAPYSPSFTMKAKAVYSFSLENKVKARYIKIRFFVENHIYFGGIKAYGFDLDGSEMVLSGKRADYESVDRFEKSDCFDRIKNIASIPFGFSPKGDCVRISKTDFASVLGYFDGVKISDRLFDAIILDLKPFAKSGGSFSHRGGQSKLTDWEELIDELFLEDFNLSALNDTVKLLKNASVYPKDYKLKVFLTAPVPKISLEIFGNISGDGIQEKLLDINDCVDAYCWFVDTVKRRFDIAKFDEIEIIGWNWYDGYLGREFNADNPLMAKRCVNELKKRNYKSILLSFFQQGGVEKAKEIGFDLVATYPLDTRSGIEIEGLCEDYLPTLEKFGFSSAINVYNEITQSKKFECEFIDLLVSLKEQGIDKATKVFSLQSGDIIANIMDKPSYDCLYNYLKGNLEVDKPKSSVDNKDQPQQKSKKYVEPKKKKSIKNKKTDKKNKYAIYTAAAAAIVGAVYILKKFKDD